MTLQQSTTDYEKIAKKLDRMDAERNQARPETMEVLGTLATKIDFIMRDICEIKERQEKDSVAIRGNGHPEGSLTWEMQALRMAFNSHVEDCGPGGSRGMQERIAEIENVYHLSADAAHKKEETKAERKKRLLAVGGEVGKELLKLLIMGIVLGGMLILGLEQYIDAVFGAL